MTSPSAVPESAHAPVRLLAAVLTLLVTVLSAGAMESSGALTSAERKSFDAAVREVLATTGVPSASIAIVKAGEIVYLQAYGKGSLEPSREARTSMRYCIGSISKQFAAAAILMLAEEGKLSLDDPIARFIPDLTEAREVTIRQVLSHTAGYQDYWPQDYVMPGMLKPVTVDGILDRWARRPLDFEPGTQYQYSNTGFVIAGLIVERASGRGFMEFLQERIFTPLKMESVMDIDQGELEGSDAVGYMRYGLGPQHPALRTGQGWLFAAGGLAMTAEDLARWNLSVINQTLLKPQSYREMQSAVILKNGLASNYGLGVSVRRSGLKRAVGHSGMVPGFVSNNAIYPEDKAAVVVLTNGEAGAAGEIRDRIERLLFTEQDTEQAEQQARLIFQGLQRGKLDRALFTDNANFYFTEAALREMAAGLKPLGKPRSFTQVSRIERGGMTGRFFEVQFARRKLAVAQYTLPDGQIEQYLVAPSD